MKKKTALPIRVVNLKRDPARLRFMRDQLRRLGLQFQLVEAVDGSLLGEDLLRLYSKEQSRKCSGRELTRGEIGCALSHIGIWQRMLREKMREVLVLEDDVWIGEALVNVLEYRHRLPKDWEFINFSTDTRQIPFGPFLTDIYRASRHQGRADRTSAYLVNLKGARKLMDQAFPIRFTADGITWSTQVTELVSYGIYPRVAILSEIESSIWSADPFPGRPFVVKKYKELVFILKSMARFFGIPQFFRLIRRRLFPAGEKSIR